MARRETVTVTDDFDGTEGAHTVRFGLDDKTYEVDLSSDNEAEFREFVEQYIAVGRRTTRSGQRYTVDTDTVDTRAVRAWANSRGINIPARGRVGRDVIEQFRAAGH